MEYKYPDNTPSTYISYFRNREGPNGILVYYKNVSRFVTTSKQLRDVFGPARYTDSVKLVSKWCDEMIEKYDSVSADVTHDEIVKDGFGPEAHLEEDPTANTKMVI
jgi:hypothetical protein